MRFTVRAPGSSANLGPGFDALGLAVDLWNEIVVDTDGEAGSVVYEGRDADLLAESDRENLSLRAMRQLAEAHGRTLPGFSPDGADGRSGRTRAGQLRRGAGGWVACRRLPARFGALERRDLRPFLADGGPWRQRRGVPVRGGDPGGPAHSLRRPAMRCGRVRAAWPDDCCVHPGDHWRDLGGQGGAAVSRALARRRPEYRHSGWSGRRGS